ncbi:H-NS and tRNA binding protein [Pectobacterium phage PP47]|uniref:H-NS and tRNA binding protein n=2 Tax=Pektosvirus TaxID=2732689 RepID=A0A1L7DRZ3_9CAUD|nr:H-NS and tRNA binding protein [Pectobacterium phage PP81]YP_009788728.1 H-NS and tRNA binding protein [Pectobacterium phage PP47]APU03049.1 H-NS and tRNA binding protein [Pectobacterium phage PP81]APW79767.1 H-NS and tRNA binding protein [Pectobacterium phage PP47]
MAKTLSFNFKGTFSVVINPEEEQYFMDKLMESAKSPEGANGEDRYLLIESLMYGPEIAMHSAIRKAAGKAIRESLLDAGAVRVAPVRVS